MRPGGVNPFAQAPVIAIWEVTRACALACRHCRAESLPARDPGELGTDEGRALLDAIRRDFGPILMVFTGGDPLERADLNDLIAHASRIGLHPALTPSATSLLTVDAIHRLRDVGLERLAISIDGADAATHDAFRGVPGTFERSITALETARAAGLSTQINSSLWRGNRDQLAGMAEMARWLGIALWSVFVMVPTGRAVRGMLLAAREHESLYQALADLVAAGQPFQIKTTAGQPFYRVLHQRGLDGPAGTRPGMRANRAVNDGNGNGFVFVSHRGEIMPSGFLPMVCGDIRRDAIAEVYRTHPTFVALRDPSLLAGKCGRCEHNLRCGGSRSRAFGLTGDPLASDPTCVYVPEALRR